MNIDAPAFSQDLTVDGPTSGYATVTDNSGFFVGCIAFLCRTDAQQRCVITELVGGDQVGLRFIAEDNEQEKPRYGSRSNLTGWTVAKQTRLNMSSQLAKIEKPWVRPL